MKTTLKTWIETHRILWIGILALLGMIIGLVEGLLLGVEMNQTGKFCLIYSIFLVLAEITIGGSGVE